MVSHYSGWCKVAPATAAAAAQLLKQPLVYPAAAQLWAPGCHDAMPNSLT
jgi:hypothetical protein